jgi:hypothetical protein
VPPALVHSWKKVPVGLGKQAALEAVDYRQKTNLLLFHVVSPPLALDMLLQLRHLCHAQQHLQPVHTRLQLKLLLDMVEFLEMAGGWDGGSRERQGRRRRDFSKAKNSVCEHAEGREDIVLLVSDTPRMMIRLSLRVETGSRAKFEEHASPPA